MPLFSFIDTSGLEPLALPPSLTDLAHSVDGAQARLAPSPESIARFQAAMGEQQPVRRQISPPPTQEPVAIVAPQRPTPLANTVPAPSIPITAAEVAYGHEAPVLPTDVPAVPANPPAGGGQPIADIRRPTDDIQLPKAPVAAKTPSREPVPAASAAPLAPQQPVVAPAATVMTEPARGQDVAVLPSSPLPGEPIVRRAPATPLASTEPIVVATTPSRESIPAAGTAPVVPQEPVVVPAATIVTEPIRGRDVPFLPTDAPATPANPPIAGGQPIADIRRPTDDIQLPKAPVAVEKPDADNQISDEPNAAIPQLHAVPVTAAFAPTDTAPVTAAAPVALEIDPAAATARTHELVEAATLVADTILVTPSLVRGEGEITIQLKPTVLDGSEIRLEAKGSSITVAIAPATPSAAQVIAQAKVQFEQTLAERIPSFQIAVSVENLNLKTDKRKETTV